MKVQAILNKVIAKPIDKEDKTKGGIYVPSTAKEQLPIGVVVSVGEQVTSVKVGQKILFAKYQGIEIKIGEVTHFVFEDKPEHLKAIIE